MEQLIIRRQNGNDFIDTVVEIDIDRLGPFISSLVYSGELDNLQISEDSGATFTKANIWIKDKEGSNKANSSFDKDKLFCTGTRNLQNDYYEQQLEEEAENEGMVKTQMYIDGVSISPLSSDSISGVGSDFTWEEYEEWVKMGKTTGNSGKKDHSKFIQQVKDNELSKDDIVKYLEENL